MGQLTSQRSHYPDDIQGEKEIFMTGTPLRNRPSELIPLMRGLGIDVPRDVKKFREKDTSGKNFSGYLSNIIRLPPIDIFQL